MQKINDKLKAAVKKSLSESKKTRKTKETPNYESIGIPSSTTREKEITVYVLWRHERAKIDHSKFTWAKWTRVEDSPMFATHEEGWKYCQKLEKADRTWMYEARQSYVKESLIPKNVLKKIKERGW